MRALDSTIMAYCLPSFTSVSMEYQSPMLLPVLPILRLPISSISLMPLLCVSLGALALAAVFDGSSTGDGGVLAVADAGELSVELTDGKVDGCDWVLSCASNGTLTTTSTAITAARACDFMGKLQCRNANPHLTGCSLRSLYAWNHNVAHWISATLLKLQRFCKRGELRSGVHRLGTAETGLE